MGFLWAKLLANKVFVGIYPCMALQDYGDEGISRSDKLAELARLTGELESYHQTNKLRAYRPYPKQMEFHNASGEYRERCLMAGNQLGKTFSAGMELSMHMTGIYPDWWKGRRFVRGQKWWVLGVTSESTRDNPQRILMGEKREYGTGTIPGGNILDVQLGRGVPDLLDSVVVRHSSGDNSYIRFKSYERGREKLQGETLTGGAWLDEEPPYDIYSEILTRTNATDGMIMLTYTPLLGMTKVVRRYLESDDAVKRFVVTMTIDDAGHIDEKKKNEVIASYEDWERDARIRGIPMLGSGSIYPVDESSIKFDLSEFSNGFPSYWPVGGGMDLGDWDHPTAAVWARWDRDTDVVYITDCYRQNKEKLAVHASVIRSKGKHIPMAWPHDALKTDRTAGIPIAELYRKEGVKMMRERAQYSDGTWSPEAGIQDLLDRMHTGRLKVASHLNDWFEEFRLYHRKDGKIFKERDDLMDATRYMAMSLRHFRRDGVSHSKPKILGTVGNFNPFKKAS